MKERVIRIDVPVTFEDKIEDFNIEAMCEQLSKELVKNTNLYMTWRQKQIEQMIADQMEVIPDLERSGKNTFNFSSIFKSMGRRSKTPSQ